MERLYYTVQTAEEALDDELLDAYRGERGEYLASDECENGKLYWGGGRSIGELAICRGKDEYGRMQFEGLRNKFGVDYLFIEYHYDDDPSFGTYTPSVKLETAPDFETEEQAMYWILEQQITLIKDRLQWLKYLPDRLKSARSYNWLIDRDQELLDDALRMKEEGFSDTPAPTFRQIIEAKQRELVDTGEGDQLVEAAGE
ncbi:hypothetical protein KC973_02405 [Candidatus Saccharibacteria bacterium]|nr:hypothetical protein [Candidatus Saccharibacteria bacterium]